jgi:hypothetical protein
MCMPHTGHIEETATEDGNTVEKLHIEFTNGSLKQLRDLADYFDIKKDDPTEVITLGISFLQNIKDRNKAHESEKTTKED